MEAAFEDVQMLILSFILATMIFGLSLDIKPRDFLHVVEAPKAPAAGLVAQFLLLPATTFLITMLVDLSPPIELSMMLVASCPGGATSNFITLLARGNVALSLSMTAVSSLLAIVLMPINFGFWASLNPETAAFLQAVEVDASGIFQMLIFVLAIPLLLGQLVRHYVPILAALAHKLLKPTSFLILLSFVVVAVVQNLEAFMVNFQVMFTIVLLHNATAFFLGFIAARIGKLDGPDTRAVSIEVGIQNSSLAITLIYSQFAGNADMLLIAALWGTWHLIAGFLVAGGSQLWLKNSERLSNEG